jgi:hypothetical protein
MTVVALNGRRSAEDALWCGRRIAARRLAVLPYRVVEEIECGIDAAVETFLEELYRRPSCDGPPSDSPWPGTAA